MNGILVQLPEAHDVILVDDADAKAVIVGTLRVGGSEPEWIEGESWAAPRRFESS